MVRYTQSFRNCIYGRGESVCLKKKKQPGLLPGQDTHQLLEAMDKIANGNFEEADVTQFKNPVYAEKINAMLHAFKKCQ